jgi:hypothetical protein
MVLSESGKKYSISAFSCFVEFCDLKFRLFLRISLLFGHSDSFLLRYYIYFLFTTYFGFTCPSSPALIIGWKLFHFIFSFERSFIHFLIMFELIKSLNSIIEIHVLFLGDWNFVVTSVYIWPRRAVLLALPCYLFVFVTWGVLGWWMKTGILLGNQLPH